MNTLFSLFFCSLLFSLNLLAAINIDLDPKVYHAIDITTPQDLFLEKASGTTTYDGSSESKAFRIYLPFIPSDSTDLTPAANHLFRSVPHFDSNYDVTLYGLQYTNPNGQLLHIAFKNNNQEYQVIGHSALNSTQITAEGIGALSNLTTTNPTGKFTLYFYLFLPTSFINIGDTFSTTTPDESNPITDSLFFQLKFAPYTDGTSLNYPAVHSGVIPGDQELHFSYDTTNISSFIKDDFNGVIIIPLTTAQPLAISYNSLPLDTAITVEEENTGNLSIKNLTNGVEYFYSFALLNKYKFTSLVSPSVSGTPKEIQVFLQEKGCFLLAASFQEDHFILDFFRFVRDRVLDHLTFGRSFINWYYNTAPAYTPYILNTPSLQYLIQFLAYLFFALIILTPVLLIRWSFLKIQKLKMVKI